MLTLYFAFVIACTPDFNTCAMVSLPEPFMSKEACETFQQVAVPALEQEGVIIIDHQCYVVPAAM